MVTIYHYPNCSKSREGLEFLKEKADKFEVKDYIKSGISEQELSEIISWLEVKPLELVRQKELLWKENYADRQWSDSELIKIMVSNPKLIERPIVVNGSKAVIGRPKENIKNIL